MVYLIKKNNIFVFILAFGVFGIINTEMGIIGILPYIAKHFSIDIVQAGKLVSFFALAVAVAGPTMPLIFSGINRKWAMLIVLGIFLVSNIISVFAQNFTTLLIVRVIPAIFHPVYCSMAFSLAAESVEPKDAPKAVAKIVVGVSAGMVIGVPVSNYIAETISLTTAMTCFAVINAIVFLATLFIVPSLPIKHRLSYGSQLSILKNINVHLSILAVILMNGAVFGIFNYLTEYLNKAAGFEGSLVSILLFVYGLMNIVGSMLAGELLSRNVLLTVRFFIISLLVVYFLLFLWGKVNIFMIVLIIIWGILGGVNANITQYWIIHSAPKAPDFANGLFLTSANLGTTLGTLLGGIFISNWGISYLPLTGIIFIFLSGIVIYSQLKFIINKT